MVRWHFFYVILEIMTSDCMDILIHIGLEVSLTERALQDVFLCLGSSILLGQSRKQSSSRTAEAEYIVACSSSCESIWLRKLLTDLFDLEMESTMILCDNQSCIKMTENHVFHDKSKHIEI
jgi:hypothetical protein